MISKLFDYTNRPLILLMSIYKGPLHPLGLDISDRSRPSHGYVFTLPEADINEHWGHPGNAMGKVKDPAIHESEMKTIDLI